MENVRKNHQDVKCGKFIGDGAECRLPGLQHDGHTSFVDLREHRYSFSRFEPAPSVLLTWLINKMAGS